LRYKPVTSFCSFASTTSASDMDASRYAYIQTEKIHKMIIILLHAIYRMKLL